jgi:hypothetical protein
LRPGVGGSGRGISANLILKITIADLEHSGRVRGRHVVVATDKIVDVLAVVQGGLVARIAHLHAELA